MTDSNLVIGAGTRSRCPQCDHPSNVTLDRRTEPLPFDEVRHSVQFGCDKGHCWTTSWTTEASA